LSHGFLNGSGRGKQLAQGSSNTNCAIKGEGVDSKLGGINRFTTVADIIDHFRVGSFNSPN